MPAKFNAILPSSFNERGFEKAVKTSQEKAAELIVIQFELSVKDFKRKPNFITKIKGNTITVITDDENYEGIVRGRPRHTIVPKKGKVLSFLVGGQSKTRPKVIPSRPGRKGTKRVFTKKVNHPGNKPRNTDIEIKKKLEKDGSLKDTLQEGLDAGAKASGHSI